MKLKDAILIASLTLNAYHLGSSIFDDIRKTYGLLGFLGAEEVKEKLKTIKK